MQKRGLYFWMTVAVFCAWGGASPMATNAQWVAEGQAPEGRWTAGFRAGFSPLTQEMFGGSDTSVGPVLNFMGMYGINKWMNVGLMLEYNRHGVSTEGTQDIGTLNTVSLLPTVEFRPGRYGRLIPYGSVGMGVNVNSLSQDDASKRNVGTLSAPNTFAFRLAGGVDYPLSDKLALNTEVAWKRNRGGIEQNDVDAGPFDASSINVLFGVKYTFR
ncbi:MAG TPA: outer membrane beta-barrel protein [Nitrospiraceae bacterium]|nr:outer membrane beta-barrel protein [Nitrospiraceae bacterium]